ncbi:AEC family transporter [Arcobacteraceae bacterium]|nr:AEC family transporter [Arcobacteraceae bacterium]
MLIINTLLPIFFLILIGYFFKHIKFPDESFWKHLDKFNYFVLFPALLLYKLSTADIKNIVSFDFIFVAIISLLIISLLLMLINKKAKFKDDSYTSIFQGAIRFNTYVFIALIDALLSDESFVLAMLLITFIIPFINILCISTFSLYVAKNKVTIYSFLKSIFRNPLILACLFGGLFNFFGFTFPIVIQNSLSILSSAALPLGLLSVGVGLHLKGIKETKIEMIVSVFAKLLLLPLLVYVIGNFAGLKNDTLILLVLFATIPTAPSGYALARELGGDLKLISSIISIQTVISIFTISIVMWVLNIS